MAEVHSGTAERIAEPSVSVASPRPMTRAEALEEMKSLLCPRAEVLANVIEDSDIESLVHSLKEKVKICMYQGPKVSDPERDERLKRWARFKGISRDTVFDIQGVLIRQSYPSMCRMADELLLHPCCRLDRETLMNAGYAALKAVACAFDPPEKHGNNFAPVAEPLIRAALLECIARDYCCISRDITMEELQQWKECQSVQPQRSSITTPIRQATVPQVQPLRKEEAPKTASDESEDRKGSDDPEVHDEEWKRRRRLARFAKDEHGVPVDQNDFEGAVQGLADKFHSLANGVANGVTIPSSFGGGKRAVRQEAVHQLPAAIRSFDPTGGVHFTKHLQDALAIRLQEYVKTGKRRRE